MLGARLAPRYTFAPFGVHILLVKIVGFEHMHIAVEDLVTVARHGGYLVILIAEYFLHPDNQRWKTNQS